MEPQAQLFYNVLEAIFDYADANLEPKGLGLMTMAKQIAMFEKAGTPEFVAVYKTLPPHLLAEMYKIDDCQFYMVPSDDINASPYSFREPTYPAMTKAGWIKMEVIGMVPNIQPDRNSLSYQNLQGYITNCDLKIKDPNERARFGGERYLPFPDKPTVEWYAKSAASALKFENILENSMKTQACFENWAAETIRARSEQQQRAPDPPGMTEAEFERQREQILSHEREIQLLNMATMYQTTQRLIEWTHMEFLMGIDREERKIMHYI